MLRAGVLRLGRRTALAGATATATATAAVALCEQSSPASVPAFVLGGDRYDQTTFSGRLSKIQELIDVRTAFTTDEQLEAAQSLLAKFKEHSRLPAGVSDEQMWEAQSRTAHGAPPTPCTSH